MLIGLDMAGVVGWVAGDGSDIPAFGHVQLAPADGETRAQAFSEFRRFLRRLLRRYQPTHVMAEKPILPKAFIKDGRIIYPTKLETTMMLQGLSAISVLECYDAGIPYEFVDVGSVKKELAGRGDAKKVDMVRVARRAGVPVEVHDEADAFGCWLVGVRKHAKQHSEAWDRRIYSHGRGGLL